MLAEAEIGGQHRHRVAALRQSASKRAHFDDWPASIFKWKIRLHGLENLQRLSGVTGHK
jgi:hypothetical protein